MQMSVVAFRHSTLTVATQTFSVISALPTLMLFEIFWKVPTQDQTLLLAVMIRRFSIWW